VRDAQDVAKGCQFPTVSGRNATHECRTAGRQSDLDPARVVRALLLADEPARNAPLDQCGRRMRTRLQALGERPNRRPVARCLPGDVQEQQVLRLRQPRFTRRSDAEALKPRELVAKLRQGNEFFSSDHVRVHPVPNQRCL